MELTNNAPLASASAANAFTTMFYEPTTAFRQLEDKPKAWFPTLVLILATCAVMFWYYAMVDFAWLLDQMLTAIKSAEEREAAAKVMSKTMMQVSTLGSTVLGYPLVFAVTGVYLMLVSKALSHGISFGKGFALAAWSSVPGVLVSLLGVMQLLLASSGQLSYSELNPVSLNQLLFQYDMAHPLASLTDTVSLMTFWSMFLMVIGFEVWAKVKRSTAILVVLVPYLLVYGGWAAYGMSQLA